MTLHTTGAKKPFDFEMGKFLKSRQWGRTKPFQFTYYGWDKYKTKAEIRKYIYESQKEFKRVLADDGLLLVKWNEVRIALKRFLTMLPEWRLLIELPISDPNQTWGSAQTYWLMMEKKKEEYTPLDTLPVQPDIKQACTVSEAYGTLLPYLPMHQSQTL